jgi:hypothetical protein
MNRRIELPLSNQRANDHRSFDWPLALIYIASALVSVGTIAVARWVLS